MANNDTWTYYTYGGLVPGTRTTYLRYDRGRAEVFSTERGIWVPSDGPRISRYIQNGEASLNKSTREGIEAALGISLPV